MGHRLVGDITSDKETVSTSILGLAPMAFELPMTTPQSNSGSGTSSTAPRNNQTPSPANTSGTGSKPTPTPSTKTIVILEATVKVGKCEVQLERLEKENDTLFKKVKGRDIEIFVVDEIRVNGDWQDLDNGPDSPTVASLRSFLQQSAASCYKP
jgi:cell division septation protein DedD